MKAKVFFFRNFEPIFYRTVLLEELPSVLRELSGRERVFLVEVEPE